MKKNLPQKQVEYINTKINIPNTSVAGDDNTHSKGTENTETENNFSILISRKNLSTPNKISYL